MSTQLDYASAAKKGISRKPPDKWNKDDSNDKYQTLSRIIPFKSFLTNAIALDFRNTKYNFDEATDAVFQRYPKKNMMDDSGRSKVLQIGFKSSEDREEAMKKGLVMDGITIRKTRLSQKKNFC